jgi:hypothetical protein
LEVNAVINFEKYLHVDGMATRLPTRPLEQGTLLLTPAPSTDLSHNSHKDPDFDCQIIISRFRWMPNPVPIFAKATSIDTFSPLGLIVYSSTISLSIEKVYP